MLCLGIAGGLSTKIIVFEGSALWEPCFSSQYSSACAQKVMFYLSGSNASVLREQCSQLLHNSWALDLCALFNYLVNGLMSHALDIRRNSPCVICLWRSYFVLNPFGAFGYDIVNDASTNWLVVSVHKICISINVLCEPIRPCYIFV